MIARILVVCFVAVVLLTGWFFLVATERLEYDMDHPAYGFLESQLAIANGSEDRAIDFTGLNVGDWVLACLAGGYNDPISVIENAAAQFDLEVIVSENQRTRIDWLESGSRLAAIEEFELMLIYVDGSKHAQFVLHPGFGSFFQHYSECARPDQPTITLRGH
jgi:hypothetical protein